MKPQRAMKDCRQMLASQRVLLGDSREMSIEVPKCTLGRHNFSGHPPVHFVATCSIATGLCAKQRRHFCAVRYIVVRRRKSKQAYLQIDKTRFFFINLQCLKKIENRRYKENTYG